MHYSKNSKSTAKAEVPANLPFLYLALPVMDEPDLLPRTLNCIAGQTYRKFKLVICVNQPELWWSDPLKVTACHHNRDILDVLQKWKGGELVVLDHSTEGHGWIGKRHGVGHARKTIMDHISHEADPQDVIVSLDADTTFSEDYLRTVAENFATNKKMVALAAPYYHPLTGHEIPDRAMLRYEIYMRHYFLNMAFINSPYLFTALGSALAVPVWAYRAVGGMTPKMSGEDFYFLQKLTKFGPVGLWNDEVVYPEARLSDRVFFGTGPALIQGVKGDWSSYPIYPCSLFDQISETYNLLPELHHKTFQTPVVAFISKIFNEADPFQPLRENHKIQERFIRAFHEKFDGLRILQFLKTTHEESATTDEENLSGFLIRYFKGAEGNPINTGQDRFSFQHSSIDELVKIREFLFQKEMGFRANAIPG